MSSVRAKNKVKVGIWITKTTASDLKDYAASLGKNMTEFITDLVEAQMKGEMRGLDSDQVLREVVELIQKRKVEAINQFEGLETGQVKKVKLKKSRSKPTKKKRTTPKDDAPGGVN